MWYSTSKRLTFIGLLLFAAIIAFQPVFFAPTYIIVFFWFFYLLSFKLQRLSRLKRNGWFWWFAAFYVWYVIGAFYSTDSQEAGRLIVLKITMFLWPLAFGSLGKLSHKQVKYVLYAFIMAMLVSSFSCILLGFMDAVKLNNFKLMFGYDLARWRFLSNHYFGMYTSFAILILLADLMKSESKKDVLIKTKIALLIYFSIFLVMLSVRIQLLALPMGVAVLFFASDLKREQKIKWVKRGSLAFVVFVTAVFVLPDSRRRVIETFHEIRSFEKVVDDKQTNHRVYIWKEAKEVIQQNFWLGTGTGGEDAPLAERLDKVDAKFWDGQGVYYLSRGGFNYHNQLMQSLASNGVLGFIFIFGMFVGGMVYALRYKRGLVAAWLALVFVSFITESMLERQAGVLFFSFFYGLLIINQVPGQTEESS